MTDLDTISPQETVVIDGYGITLNYAGAVSPSELLAIPRLAIVGARASTMYGVHVASELAALAVQAGYAVISGGAYGIDAAAHRAAEMAGGVTIAVLACGVDVPYPRGHDLLFRDIQKTGALFSEYPDGKSPTRQQFLARNRIIALLATDVVVVEAGLRSGSLNTAEHALTFHRRVYAVPGPVTSATSAGSNDLLKRPEVYALTGISDLKGNS